MKRRLPILLIAAVLLTELATAQIAKTPEASGFSFDVYGDSRSMLFLPYRQDQEAEARKYLADIYELALSEGAAADVANKDAKFIYDPSTHELLQIDAPLHDKRVTLTFDKGWVTEASVEDTQRLPGVRRNFFRLAGGDWVAREVVRDVKDGNARFIVNTGDLVFWGKQAGKPSENPYWKLVNQEVLQQLPPPDAQMKQAGLGGRVFPAVGNHEVWDDSDVEGLLAAFPYLKDFGVTDKRLLYKFDFEGVRFIFLWTGKYDLLVPSAWDATRPSYEAQMNQLRTWLDEAKSRGLKKVFISFHYPTFCRFGFGGIPEPDNPHQVIASYAKDLDIVVFNGHVHTTEVFQVDGVKYFVLGGGGAEQEPTLPGTTKVHLPANYPTDLYWKNQPPEVEYNFVHVEVQPGQPTQFTLHRFRPWSAEPFATVELFK